MAEADVLSMPGGTIRSPIWASWSARSTGHLAWIEATYRGVYLPATLCGEELLRASREKDLDELVEEARKAMRGTMDQGPARWISAANS